MSTWGERLLIKGESVIFTCYTATRQMLTLHPPLLCPTWMTPSPPHPSKQTLEGSCTEDPFLLRTEMANQVLC